MIFLYLFYFLLEFLFQSLFNLGNCGFQIDFTKTFSLSINGELSAKAEVSAGIKGFISLDIGDKGVLIGIASTSIIPLSNDIKLSHSIKIYTGEVSLYARG